MHREKINEVIDKIKAIIGSDYNVSHLCVTKNNGKKRNGISIGKDGERYAPIVYVTDEELENKTPEEIAEFVIRVYKKTLENEVNIDANQLIDKNFLLKNAKLMLISKEANKELLETLPYEPYLDMAVICIAEVAINKAERGRIKVSNEYMKAAGVTKEELFEAAAKNLEQKGFYSIDLIDTLKNFSDEPKMTPIEELTSEDKSPMIIITTKDQTNGAIAMLFDDVLEKLHEVFEDDYYIIPSSIHEFIATETYNVTTAMNLKKMVAEVNDNNVSLEERLTHSVYRYDSAKKSLVIA